MVKFFIVVLINFLLLLLVKGEKYRKELYVKFNDTIFNNLQHFVNDCQNYNELYLYFTDDYYDMSILPYDVEITVSWDIYFIGNKNGTVFNYKRDRYGKMIFTYPLSKGYKVKFENIILEDYYNKLRGNRLINVVSNSNNYYFEMYKCIFRDISSPIFRINVNSNHQESFNTKVYINDCSFINNTGGIFDIENFEYQIFDINNSLLVHINNCRLIGNNGIFISKNAHVIIENSYISGIGIYTDYKNDTYSLYRSLFAMDSLKIKNSIFEKINVKTNHPLITGDKIFFEMENCKFINCHSNYGYLIEINNNLQTQNILVKNSIFEDVDSIFLGKNNSYEFTNCTFENTNMKKALPVIANAKYSKYTINNSRFRNLTLSNGLFGIESEFNFIHTKLIDIKTFSNPVIHCVNHNLFIDSMEVENLKCTDDIDHASFIVFDSGEIEKSILINNVSINNSHSNGPFIKINGESTQINILNSSINHVSSYDSIIKNNSKKSNIKFSDIVFNNNSNNNKLECGTIHFTNNVNLSITNSEFNNNWCKSSGGVICIDNIMNLDLNLNSNTFSDNKASNGGALYIVENEDDDNYQNNNFNRSIYMENNNFKYNSAENFGGAIYFDNYKKTQFYSKKNEFSFNEAGIMGGGIFSKEAIENNLFNINTINNTVSNVLSNISTKPSYITLNITHSDETLHVVTGEYFPLIFNLYNGYDEILTDVNKYYSFITLKVELKVKDKEEFYSINNEKNEDAFSNEYILEGNSGSFINGQCILNNFRIYSEPRVYILHVTIENYNQEIQKKFTDIEIYVDKCESNKITMAKQNKFPYCEEPICTDECPTSTNAYCKGRNNVSINDPKLNQCVCLPGWEGANCNHKIHVDYSNLKNTSKILSLFFFFVIVLFIIFFTIHKNEGIIHNQGFVKIFLFSFGLILYYIGNSFTAYKNYQECYLNLFFKHSGIILSFSVCYIINMLNYELGRKPNMSRSKRLFGSNDVINDNIESLILSKTSAIRNIEANCSSTSRIDIFSKSGYSKNSFHDHITQKDKSSIWGKRKKRRSSVTSGEYTEGSIKIIKKINSLVIETICLYLIIIISIITVILIAYVNVKNDTYEESIAQQLSGEWYYKCPLERYDIIYAFLEYFILFITLIKGNTIGKYERVFIITKYITVASIFGIGFGPLIDIISFLFFQNQRIAKFKLSLYVNSIGYFIIYILFSWDKVYYIMKKEGNVTFNYFVYARRTNECAIHHSTICTCKRDSTYINEELILLNKKALEFYSVCSTVFEVKNNKISYLNVQSKMELLENN
ncbi:hypothetical protein BCR36DRAFT_356203 [Piromyces finnis]|uniref:EGF-like domain-containing protein n=1 Tax=Piromyces finnis TaxID=1754191 RepID=A0A1Y1V4Z0_9FUNG|nr:hypothetical protein BCR36DRAFT_356203 [Piromyces finnis]|eukprot:ORX46842.1 hypothetical protein BCR36DRAFT_356203 [Piromyces finnis]